MSIKFDEISVQKSDGRRIQWKVGDFSTYTDRYLLVIHNDKKPCWHRVWNHLAELVMFHIYLRSQDEYRLCNQKGETTHIIDCMEEKPSKDVIMHEYTGNILDVQTGLSRKFLIYHEEFWVRWL